MNEDTVRRIIQEEIEKDKQKAQYSFSRTSFHTHNGIDSPSIVTSTTGGAAGSSTEVQFNTGGVFDASPNFVFDNSASVQTLTVGDASVSNLIEIGAPGGSPRIMETDLSFQITTNDPANNVDAADISFSPGTASGTGLGGTMTIAGGATENETGGDTTVQGGSSTNTEGGDLILQGGSGGTISGNVYGGDSIATNASGGYFLIPNCTGIPTGTPINVSNPDGALVADRTNHHLYVYLNGTWHQII